MSILPSKTEMSIQAAAKHNQGREEKEKREARLWMNETKLTRAMSHCLSDIFQR